ncbi:MAG TPA: transcriptional regulator [Bacillota bacterium]|nr:transcriptional regulator [Bacillota bacterium]
MPYIRVGEKLVSKDRIMRTVEKVLDRRAAGMSQQDVANELQLDRSFISRLETIGELRKGGKIALVGFPVLNKQEIYDVAAEFGVDYVFLLTDEERWKWVRETTGAELLNELMELVANIRSYDSVILIGSGMRIKLTEALVDKQIIPIFIGETPIREDKYVDPEELRTLLRGLVS